MINNKITIAKADLDISFNTLTPIEIDPKLQITTTSINESITTDLYPISIQIINDSGVELSYNPILSDTEYQLYKTTPSLFALQRLTKDFVLTTDHTNFAKCYKFLIMARTSGATTDLQVEFINYK